MLNLCLFLSYFCTQDLVLGCNAGTMVTSLVIFHKLTKWYLNFMKWQKVIILAKDSMLQA